MTPRRAHEHDITPRHDHHATPHTAGASRHARAAVLSARTRSLWLWYSPFSIRSKVRCCCFSSRRRSVAVCSCCSGGGGTADELLASTLDEASSVPSLVRFFFLIPLPFSLSFPPITFSYASDMAHSTTKQCGAPPSPQADMLLSHPLAVSS